MVTTTIPLDLVKRNGARVYALEVTSVVLDGCDNCRLIWRATDITFEHGSALYLCPLCI